MILAIHPRLAERAIFEAVRHDATLASLYHRQFADCYNHRDPTVRNDAFDALHQRWFDELGLRDRVARLVAEFPNLRDRVARLVLAPASTPIRQTAELFGSPEYYTVTVEVAPTLLLEAQAFAYWARHEFLHIDDMLDAEFAFDRNAIPEGATPAARNLSHDRFAVLWAISVDARLDARGQIPSDVREKRLNEYVRVSCVRDRAGPLARFTSIWEQFREERPTHLNLLTLAGKNAFDVPSNTPVATILPGAACPLCQFPTFDWATADELRTVEDAVRVDFENWREAHGACRRCMEMYQSQQSIASVAAGSA